jgi:hypothetical protein
LTKRFSEELKFASDSDDQNELNLFREFITLVDHFVVRGKSDMSSERVVSPSLHPAASPLNPPTCSQEVISALDCDSKYFTPLQNCPKVLNWIGIAATGQFDKKSSSLTPLSELCFVKHFQFRNHGTLIDA